MILRQPSLHVLSPGFLTTIQDTGRFGYAHLGISPAGAADAFALRVGNLLVRNPQHAAALEMTLVGGKFLFTCASVIALTGAACNATLDEVAVPDWRTLLVQAGQTLQCRAMHGGARTYLCVHGGIPCRPLLQSFSTHVQTGLGGRVLKAGDTFDIAEASARAPLPRASFVLWNYLAERNLLRVTHGPQTDFFTPTACAQLCASPYVVTEASNRAGLRLQGAALTRVHEAEMLTEGVSCGAVQVPHEGQPIILMVEAPTTGGYPKLAHVIAADLPRLGQLRPRDMVQFQFVTMEAAHALYAEQEKRLQKLSCALAFNAQ